MDTLSDDARCVASAWFGMGNVGTSTLTFHLQTSRPTARTQAALDELVKAGVLTSAPFNQCGGITYTLAKEFKKASFALMDRNSFILCEPIKKTRTAR